MRWAPVLFVPAPIHSPLFRSGLLGRSAIQASPGSLTDFRFTPRYPAKSPLDDVLRLAAPGTDEYVTKGYVYQISRHAWKSGVND